jgi:hypothetical protein
MKSEGFVKPSLFLSMRRDIHLKKGRVLRKNRAFALMFWIGLIVLPVSVLAQDQNFSLPSTTGTLGSKDARALAEIKAYLLAVSAAGWQSLEGEGTLTYPNGAAHSAILYLKGSKYSRLDVKMDSGMRSLRVSGFTARSQDEKGNTGVLTPTTASSGIAAFSRIWTDAAVSGRVSLRDQKIYVASGQRLHRITIEYPIDDEKGSFLSKRTAATDLYFDPNTHLLLFSVDSFSVSMMRRRLTRVTSYSGYQPFDGVSVPTTIKQALNGQDQWTLQLSHVAINTNLPANNFLF